MKPETAGKGEGGHGKSPGEMVPSQATATTGPLRRSLAACCSCIQLSEASLSSDAPKAPERQANSSPCSANEEGTGGNGAASPGASGHRRVQEEGNKLRSKGKGQQGASQDKMGHLPRLKDEAVCQGATNQRQPQGLPGGEPPEDSLQQQLWT